MQQKRSAKARNRDDLCVEEFERRWRRAIEWYGDDTLHIVRKRGQQYQLYDWIDAPAQSIVPSAESLASRNCGALRGATRNCVKRSCMVLPSC
jgi:hypothetical protein